MTRGWDKDLLGRYPPWTWVVAQRRRETFIKHRPLWSHCTFPNVLQSDPEPGETDGTDGAAEGEGAKVPLKATLGERVDSEFSCESIAALYGRRA